MKNVYDYIKIKNQKNNENFLYNYGFENVELTSQNVDILIDEYQDLEFPKATDSWFENYNDSIKNDIKRNDKILKFNKTLRKISMWAILFFLSFSILTYRVEAFRVTVLNLIYETTERFSSFKNTNTLTDNTMALEDWEDFYQPQYIPDGYTLEDSQILEQVKVLEYENTENSYFTIYQCALDAEYQIDTENAKIIDVDINDCQGVLVIKDDLILISFNTQDQNIVVLGNIGKSVILKIAENIKK